MQKDYELLRKQEEIQLEQKHRELSLLNADQVKEEYFSHQNSQESERIFRLDQPKNTFPEESYSGSNEQNTYLVFGLFIVISAFAFYKTFGEQMILDYYYLEKMERKEEERSKKNQASRLEQAAEKKLKFIEDPLDIVQVFEYKAENPKF